MKGIKDFYNKTAAQWAEEWYSNEILLPLLKRFICLLPAEPRVLDAGCGAGYESMRLFSLGAEVVGIDISEESIRIAKAKNPDCRFEVMNCMQIEDSIGVFDGIAAIALLVHIKDNKLPTVFAGFNKALKPEGYLFTAFAEGNGLSEKRSFVEVDGEKYNRAFYLHQPKTIKETAHNYGFEYSDEWFLDEPIGEWKYLVFKAE